MNKPTIRQPTVFLPIAMSLIALSMMLIHFALFGIVHESHEGPAAHIFQILMVAQLPIVFFFAIKWLPPAPHQTLKLLVLQGGFVLVAISAVLFLTLGHGYNRD